MAGVRFVERNGFRVQRQAIQAIPKRLERNTVHAAVRNVGTVVRRAEEIFDASILRPGEKGHGEGGRRQTGNFEFGTGNTFVGETFKLSEGRFGFGFPDIDRADSKTNKIWRALEFGLSGTKRKPEARFSENTYLILGGVHRMPERYEFSTKNPSSSYLSLGRRKREVQFAEGIEGKHFIEDAWASSLETIAARYKKAVTDAIASFGKS